MTLTATELVKLYLQRHEKYLKGVFKSSGMRVTHAHKLTLTIENLFLRWRLSTLTKTPYF